MTYKRTGHRYLAIGLVLLMILPVLWTGGGSQIAYAADEFAGGDGSAGDPYQITKLEHLNNMRNYLDKHFILMNDLDFNQDTDYLDTAHKTAWTTGEGWTPVGTNASQFTGSLDGGGHTVTGLIINRDAANYIGLFGYIASGAQVKNIILNNVNITGYDYTGGLAGQSSGILTSCGVSGCVAGRFYAGGLTGQNGGTVSSCSSDINSTSPSKAFNYWGGLAGCCAPGSEINDSHATGSITLTSTGYRCGSIGGLVGGCRGTINNSHAAVNISVTVSGRGSMLLDMGGLAGFLGGTSDAIANVTGSYSSGSVTGNGNDTGGLIGYTEYANISASYSLGSASGRYSSGGLIGIAYDATMVENCYSLGSVTAISGNAGGLIGRTLTHNLTPITPIVTNCYSAASMTSSTKGGLIAAMDKGIITNSYYDSAAAGCSDTGKGDPKTSAQMRTKGTFTGWDFDTVWDITDTKTNCSYPYLRSAAQNPAPGYAAKVPVTAEPQDTVVKRGENTGFNVAATGAGLTYQWQADTGSGFNNITDGGVYSGATTAALSITGAAAGMNGYKYRAIVSGTEAYTATSDSASLTVRLPNAPVISVAAGDSHSVITWNPVAEATGYYVYSSNVSGSYGTALATVSGSVYQYDAVGLANGATYYFTVKATGEGIESDYSNEVSATPQVAAPGAPGNITVVAGNGQATVSFTAPEDNGGSPITGYIVTANPGGKTATGTGSPITLTGLTNGTSYTFTVQAVNAAGTGEESAASSAVIPHGSSGRDDTATGNTSAPPAEPIKPAESGVEILVNGRPETAAASTTITTGDKTVTTITVDDKKVEEKLQNEGNNAVVTIPVQNNADVVIGQLNGQTVKNMENKEAVLEIKTGNITYTLPAAQINIDNVSSQIGEQVKLQDITVNIEISAASQDKAQIIEDTANRNNYQIVVNPVEFNITCTSGNKTVEVSRFNGYVERMVAIPDGVDPGKITTGVVLNADGSFSHVPTVITLIDGKYYAKINSLTNSTYSVIYNPQAFKDVEKHWAREAINDMGSRLVIYGTNEGAFEPDRDITRAEFAAIIARALGLTGLETGRDTFNDVNKADWYYDAVSIAYDYGIISGYGNREFGPTDKVTREQAMTMIARAMKITGCQPDSAGIEAGKLLESFIDASATADYAQSKVAEVIKAGIVAGRTGNVLAPQENMTKAETAVMVRKLLQTSGLI